MPVVNIGPREVKKLVDGGGDEWYVESVNQSVLLNSLASRVRDSGRELDNGAKARVELSGTEDTLYAFNPANDKTAKVRVDRDNFVFDLLPRKVTETEDAQAARQGTIKSADGGNVSVGTGDSTINGYENLGDDTEFLINTSARIVGGDYSADVSFAFKVLDENDNLVFIQNRPAAHSFVNYRPALPLKPGWYSQIGVNNPTGAPISIDTSSTIRE